jgi:hypothetical protein
MCEDKRIRTSRGGVPFGNLGSLESFNGVCLDWIARRMYGDGDVRSGGRVIELSHDCYLIIRW